MIKTGIKNYFVNLKHFFTPIGTLAVGMFIGLSILIPGALSILSGLIEKLAEIVQDASIDFTPLKDSVVEAVKALDWSDPLASLKIMLSREWVTGVINGCINAVSSGLQPYAEAITAAVNDAVNGVVALFALFLVFCVLGLIGGFFLTRFLVRRTMAKRTFKKFLFAVFVDSFVTTALIAICFWLVTLWAPSIFISSVLSLVIFGCTSLISAYNVHGKNSTELKTVLNFHNVFKLLLCNALIFIISLIFLALSIALTNIIAGVLIGFSFVEIAFLVISMNAESYVISLASRNSPQAETEQAEVPTDAA